MQKAPQDFVKNNNHEHRNAITPGLISTQILRGNLANMSQEQIQKHLAIIEESFQKETELIEQKNSQVEQGNILIFRKCRKSDDIVNRR